jgi:hypothetical protein
VSSAPAAGDKNEQIREIGGSRARARKACAGSSAGEPTASLTVAGLISVGTLVLPLILGVLVHARA